MLKELMFIQIQNTRKVNAVNKKNELITTKALVKSILEQDPATRNSDSYLYLKVIHEIAIQKAIDLSRISIMDYLSNMTMWGFPPFESVRRARQNLQQFNPELSSNNTVQAFRTENEAVFRKFARGEL